MSSRDKEAELLFEAYTRQVLSCPGDIILREGNEGDKVSFWKDKVWPWLKENRKMVAAVGIPAALVTAGYFSDPERARIYIDEMARAIPLIGNLINSILGR